VRDYFFIPYWTQGSFAPESTRRYQPIVDMNNQLPFNGGYMSNVVKVIEVLAESPKGWEDAAALAVAKASETVHGIKSIYIKDFQAEVDNNKIVNYRINAKLTFVID
jgi:flavin-binding protein dodecin